MAAFAGADCLIVRKPEAAALRAGDPVSVMPLDF
jgi:molybdopterin biosynthesis enzyme